MPDDKPKGTETTPETPPAWAKGLIDGFAALAKDVATLKAAPAPKGGDDFVDDEAQKQAVKALETQIKELQGQFGAIRNAPTEQLRKEVAERLKVKPETLANTPVEVLQAMKGMNPAQPNAPGQTDGASGRGTFSGGASQEDKDFVAVANEADWSAADIKRAGEIVAKMGLRR